MKTGRYKPTAWHPLRGGGVILAMLLVMTPLGPGQAAGASAPAPPQQAGPPASLSADDWATMQELMQAAQYQVTWQVQDGEWAYRAPNPAHDLWLAFAASGFTATRYGNEGKPLWDFGLQLGAYGEQTFPAAIAESGLSGALGRLMLIVEQYPDLKANQNFLALQEELTSTENKIGFARQYYNDSVMKYNTRIQSVPTNVVAGMFSFRQEPFFELEDQAQREAPQVKF